MDKEYSQEPIESKDLRIFADKAMQCLRDNTGKLWECLQLSTDRNLANPDSIELMALVQGGGLHYAVTHGYAKKYLDPKKNGLKDVDIYAFFKRDAGKENYKIGNNDILRCNFGRYPGKPEYEGRCIDILPYSIKEFDDIADPFVAVQKWLERGWKIIEGINILYDNDEESIKAIKEATKKWNQENGVEKEYHHQFLAAKAAIAIYPEKFLGEILWINPELK
jgi:hypothetical protein